MSVQKLDAAFNKTLVESGKLEKEFKIKGNSEQVDDKKIVKADNKNAAVLKYVEDNNKQDTGLLKKLLQDVGENIKNLISPATSDEGKFKRVNQSEKEHSKKQIQNNSMSGGQNDVSTAGVKNLVQQDPKYQDKTRNPDDNINGKYVTRYNLNAKRKKNEDEEESDDLNHRKKRKKANLPNRKNVVIPEMLKGAVVSESGTQDMFISSRKSQQRVSVIEKKPIIQEIMEYEMTNFAWMIFDTISNHVNHKSPNGLNDTVQKDYLSVLINGINKVEDVNHDSYRKYVRDVIMGTMKAALEHTLDFKDCTKMIISTLMNISPHDDDPKFMSDALNVIVSELIYSKAKIGYTLRDISYNIGAAIFTLFTYYRNYQNEIEFSKELEHKLNRAVGEALWQSISKISKNPQLAVKTNVDAFIQGRNEEENLYTKNLYKEIATTSIKKVFKK
ncbi:MAG: hypothetical protein KatS3mg068_0024 [Candidatus Sericytochromatia bacterium]|nr:MAG: hypothetical protein KatS3mg068_0024 [Candidatus Sericytochromatia bacterium]